MADPLSARTYEPRSFLTPKVKEVRGFSLLRMLSAHAYQTNGDRERFNSWFNHPLI